MATLIAPCLDCGRVGIRHRARGLCNRCYYARQRAGTRAERPRATDWSRARGATDRHVEVACAACGAPVRVRRWRAAAGPVYCGRDCGTAARRRASSPEPPPALDSDAYLARADAAIRADIRARLAAGRSTVTAHDWKRRQPQPEPLAAD